ncbi:MAG: hypothetical protein PF638_00995 [Candidatus Delongbacteria bacterium]|jgi:hypothetical protein|nr:hypothetical protein [Candidatus Delongbacteria bacterium]
MMRILLISVTLFTSLLFSQTDSTEIKGDYIIFPFGFYTTDTSVALGTFFNYNCNDEDKVFSNLIYTFKDQKIFFVITEKKIKNIFLENKFWLEDYYLEYYGFGNDTELGDEFKYGYFFLENRIDVGYEFIGSWKTFFSLNNFYYSPGYNSNDISELEDKDIYSTGVGLKIRYDTVTDNFYRDGLLFENSFLYFPEFLGKSKTHNIFESQFAYYKSINESAINLQLITRIVGGEPHYHQLSSLGGSSILRGYPERRYVDRNMIAFQSQYDVLIYKAVSLASFLSFGDVFNEIDDLSVKNIKVAYGGGFIYKIKDLGIRVEGASSLEGNLSIIITGAKAF